MPSKRESIFLVACVEEGWVRLACSHCVNRLVLGRHVQDPVHSPAFPTHWQNGFCVCRDKTTNSVRRFSRDELDFGIGVIKLPQPSSRAFGNDRMRSTPPKREAISMVPCVEEDRVQTRPGQTRSRSRSRRCRK